MIDLVMKQGLSDASQEITIIGINRFNELVKQGEPEKFAYATARRELNTGFSKFIKSLNFKRPTNADPDIPTIDLMRNDPKIGNLVKEAEKAAETGKRRLFVLLKGQEGVALANVLRARMSEPPIKTDDLRLPNVTQSGFYDMPGLGQKTIGIKSKIPLKEIIIEEAGPVSETPSRTVGPIEVIQDSQTGKYHLFDGQHRVKEAIKRGDIMIDALVAKGDPVDGGGWNVSPMIKG
jgi:hypothetical protein